MRRILTILLLCLVAVPCYAATFGNNTGTTKTRSIEGIIRGGVFTLSEDGVATSMTAYINMTVDAKLVRFMIYRASDTVLIAATQDSLVAVSDGAVTLPFNYKVNLPADNYILAAWSSAVTGVSAALLYRDFAGSGTSRVCAYTYTTWPVEPFAASEANNTDLLRIYCTYTAGYQKHFGDTTKYTAQTSTRNTIVTANFTTPASTVIASSVTAHLLLSGSGTFIIRGGLYRVSDNARIDTSVATTITTSATGLQLWREFPLVNTPTLTASTAYLPAVWSDSTGVSITVAINATTTDASKYVKVDNEVASNAWPATYAPFGTLNNDGASMFVCYTLAPSGIKGRRRKIIMGAMGLVQEAQQCFARVNDDISQ